MPRPLNDCAREVLEVVPLVMHAMRSHMRTDHDAELSVPQYRLLAFLSRHDGASLSDAVDFLGLTPPTVSRMVDHLVERRMARRKVDSGDRRRVELSLSSDGASVLNRAKAKTQSRFRELLTPLTDAQRRELLGAMRSLRGAIEQDASPNGQGQGHGTGNGGGAHANGRGRRVP